MKAAPLELDNLTARRIFLDAHALSHDPAAHNGDTLGTVRRLGFVQLDSIQTVARAHQHILATRDAGHHAKKLHVIHAEDRAVFEHWTHDSSIIPMEHYPHWKRRFAAAKSRAKTQGWWAERLGSRRILKRVLDRIAAEGPLMARDFEDKTGGGGGMWNWGRSKTALELLWHTGELAVSAREGFQKVYDLPERIIPDAIRNAAPSKTETVEWAVTHALDRLGFATPREIRKFWHFVDFDDIVRWIDSHKKRFVRVRVATAEGSHSEALALADIEAKRDAAPAPPAMMRALSPFDPAIRDRVRLKRLFGFDYTIEIFVPEAKRKFGYYVFPLLDGDRIVGRVDAKTDREADALAVRKLWLEGGVTRDAAFKSRQAAALKALAAMGHVSKVRMPA